MTRDPFKIDEPTCISFTGQTLECADTAAQVNNMIEKDARK